MTLRRGTGVPEAVTVTVVAVAMVLASMVAGCRQSSGPLTPPGPIGLTMSFTVGETFSYTSFEIDPFGYLVPSSTELHTWRVRSTTADAYGRSPVTVVTDSVRSTDGTFRRADSLYFGFQAGGDVYLYGFLAAVVARREGRSIPRQWERVAAFSMGPNVSWTVGEVDTATGDSVYGVIPGSQDFFSVGINSVQNFIPAYQVHLTGPNLDLDFWATDSPSAFLSYQEQPTDTLHALIANLDSLRHP